MEIDFGAVAILSLFRGVLGLALGFALGKAWRGFASRKIFDGGLGLLQAIVPLGLTFFMHSEIRQYDEYPFIYWGVFALAAMAGTLKTDNMMKAVSIGAYSILGGSFFFMGGWVVLSGVRGGFNLVPILAGILFMSVGGVILGAMLYPYFKGKSITDD